MKTTDIKNKKVKEKKIDKNNGNFEILLTSDWHAGADTWGIDRHPELDRSLKFLSDRGVSERVKYVVIGGDIFDSFRYPGRENLSVVSKWMERFFSIPTLEKLIVVKGNHDWNDIGGWPLFSFLDREKFIVVEKPAYIDTEDGWFSIVPHLRKHVVKESFEDTIDSAFPPNDGRPVILCAHMAIEGTIPSFGGMSEPVFSVKALDMYGDRLKGAYFGHIHSSEDYEINSNTCRYISSPMKISFAEENCKNGGIFASFDGRSIRVETPSRSMVTIKAESSSEAIKKTNEILNRQGSILEEDLEKDDLNIPFIRVILPQGANETVIRSGIEDLDSELLKSLVVLSVEKNKEKINEMTAEQVENSNIENVDSEKDCRHERISVETLIFPFFESVLPENMNPETCSSICLDLLEGGAASKIWEDIKKHSDNFAKKAEEFSESESALFDPQLDLQKKQSLSVQQGQIDWGVQV